MTCSSCGADTRSCRNCRFWSPGAWHDCAERVDDPVSDKERGNFCDYFQVEPSFKVDHPAAAKTGSAKTDEAKSAFDGLFNQ